MRKSAGERRDEIVAAALKLMVEVGPDRVTTAALAAAIGVSHAALFRHFPRKQDIWMAVLDWLRGRTEGECWPEAVAVPGGGAVKLRSLVKAQLSLIAGTPAIPALLFSRELHVESEALREGLFSLMGRFHALIAGLVRQAAAENPEAAATDTAGLAAAIASLVPGMAVRWSLSGHRFDIIADGMRALDVVLAPLEESRR
jgi:AcrR family transcriptional regulator